MTVFVKRYPEKGDFPEDGVMVYAGDGRLYYNYERKEWICADGYTHYPLFWIEEIELPSDEEIEQSSNRYYFDLEEKREKAKNFRGQIAGRHPDMLTSREMLSQMSGFVDGANYILDLLKQR